MALALTNRSGVRPLHFAGLDNFRLWLADLAFQRTLGDSVYYVVAGTVFLCVPAYLLAWCLSRPIHLNAFFCFPVQVPVVLPVSVADFM